jgi:hypothetical protein
LAKIFFLSNRLPKRLLEVIFSKTFQLQFRNFPVYFCPCRNFEPLLVVIYHFSWGRLILSIEFNRIDSCNQSNYCLIVRPNLFAAQWICECFERNLLLIVMQLTLLTFRRDGDSKISETEKRSFWSSSWSSTGDPCSLRKPKEFTRVLN